MDRRSILFVVLCFVALYLVNTYFDSNYEEELRQWQAQQKGKKEKEIIQLKHDINAQTASAAQLPLYFLYADKEASKFVATAVGSEGSLLTLSWEGEAPKEIYARPAEGEGSIQPYTLSYAAPAGVGLILYQTSPKHPLLTADLPDIGGYSVQVVEFFPDNKSHPFSIQLGEYRDGVVTLLQDKVRKLSLEIESPQELPSQPHANGIILAKKGEQFLPNAIYHSKDNAITYLEDIIGLEPFIHKEQSKSVGSAAPTVSGEQQYYVLENSYQQLVFSNVGAALVEINLPFKSSEDSVSAVRPIEIDRRMAENHPYDARFPSHPYLTAAQKSGQPFESHPQGNVGGYYPLIRRDLVEEHSKNSVRLNPRYYALNILSEFPEVAELHYKVVNFDQRSITFEAQQQHRRIVKTFSFPEDKEAPYTFDLTIQIEGDKRGLWLSSGVPEVELFSGSPAPVLKYRITRNQKSSVDLIDLPKEVTTNSSIYPDWLCNSNGFFGLILDPLSEIEAGFRAVFVPGDAVPTRLTEIDQKYERYLAKNFPGYMVMVPLNGSSASMKFRVFAGPFSDTILNAVDSLYTDSKTGYNPDYIASQSFHGWFSFISEPFAKFLFVLMKLFYSFTGSWAISIILLTVALRVMLYPLNAWSTSSMLRMQQIGPEVTALQEKYKKDPKKMQQELMALYRDRKINPISGCVPLLIQMPFLIGMFDLLKSTFALRGASFIPGWIDDLAAPDVLFSWQEPLFFIGTEFHLLPFLLGGVMYLQQRFLAPSVDPAQMTDQQRQQKSMGTIMCVVFAVMFYNFPSGLNIYWLSSTILGILQQWWTQRRMAQQKIEMPLVQPKGKAVSPKH